MKTILKFLIATILIFIILSVFQSNYVSQKYFLENKKLGIIGIQPAESFLLYAQKYNGKPGMTTKEVYEQQSPLAVINATYFGYSGEDFIPAGLWQNTGINDAVKNLCGDPNLCAVLDTSALEFGSLENQLLSGKITESLVSAGPLLITSGIINSGLTQDISHRNKKYYRTIFAKPGNIFFITTKPYTLQEISTILKNQYGITDAINFDGGPSTSLYGKTSSSFLLSKTYKRNETQKLPLFFVFLPKRKTSFYTYLTIDRVETNFFPTIHLTSDISSGVITQLK